MKYCRQYFSLFIAICDSVKILISVLQLIKLKFSLFFISDVVSGFKKVKNFKQSIVLMRQIKAIFCGAFSFHFFTVFPHNFNRQRLNLKVGISSHTTVMREITPPRKKS